MPLQTMDCNSFTDPKIFIEYLLSLKQVVEIKRPISLPQKTQTGRKTDMQIITVQYNILYLCPTYNEDTEERVPMLS